MIKSKIVRLGGVFLLSFLCLFATSCSGGSSSNSSSDGCTTGFESRCNAREANNIGGN